MGNSPSAENVADENLSAIASVVNDAVQNCGQKVNQEIAQTVKISDGTITGNLVLDSENWLILKEGCLQSESASTQLDQALQATASQAAQAIAQQFELDSAKAKNVININAQIASEVKNRFVQVCSNESNQEINQLVELDKTTVDGNITLNAKNYQQSLVECSTQGQALTDLKNQLVVQINQSASAKVENFLMPFFIALLVIIGLIALFLFLPRLFEKKKPERAPIPAQGDSTANLLAALGEEGGAPAVGAEDTGGVEAAPVASTAAPAAGEPSWAEKLESAKTNLGKYKSQAEGALAQAKEYGSKAKELGGRAKGYLARFGETAAEAV